MLLAACNDQGAGFVLIIFGIFSCSLGARLENRLERFMEFDDDPREPCKHVTLNPPTSYKPGHFEFRNANGSAFIEIEDEGDPQWSIEIRGKNRVVTRPSVHISLVSVDCVLKGMCRDMVTVALNHWRTETRKLQGDTDFSVSLQFAADPAIAGCICYMDAMMAGNTRSQLYVRTQLGVKVSTHEGFITKGKDIALSDMFEGASFTIAQAAQACLTLVPGCEGFSINRSPHEDPETQFGIAEFHFKGSMKLDGLEMTMQEWTSYRVTKGPPPPYELQYSTADGVSTRDWCKQTFQTSRSSLQGKSWLFL